MDRKKWKTKIKNASKKAGTYQPFFDSVIDTLAGILEKRDKAEESYVESGEVAVIEYTNKGGATNTVQNPALKLINELNRDALAYWKELGLTSRSYKEFTKGTTQSEEGSKLEKALNEISKELGKSP